MPSFFHKNQVYRGAAIPSAPLRSHALGLRRLQVQQDSCAIAKMTAQCAHAPYTWVRAMTNFGTP